MSSSIFQYAGLDAWSVAHASLGLRVDDRLSLIESTVLALYLFDTTFCVFFKYYRTNFVTISYQTHNWLLVMQGFIDFANEWGVIRRLQAH